MVQWIRALAPQAEGWVLESRPRQTLVIKTGSDSFTAERWEIGMNVLGNEGTQR